MLPAQASRSEPAAKEDPERAPSAAPAELTSHGLRSPFISATSHSFAALQVSRLPVLHGSPGKTGARITCPHRNLLNRSGSAVDSSAPGREKAPGDSGKRGRQARRETVQLRVRVLRCVLWRGGQRPSFHQVQDLSWWWQCWLPLGLWFVQSAAASLNPYCTTG
jgi:hypothetical protein